MGWHVDCIKLPQTLLETIVKLSLIATDGQHGTPLEVRIDDNPHLEAAVLIGRSRPCDLRLDNPSVSRRHCQLEVDIAAGCVFLRDLGSRNGTFLNGRRVHGVCEVHEEDEITVGDVALKLELSSTSSLWERVASRCQAIENAGPQGVRIAVRGTAANGIATLRTESPPVRA